MGQNFALNMASHGFSVSVSNRSPEKVDATVARAKEEGDLPLTGYKDPKSFVESLSKPRKIVLLVQAGAAVDATIATLSELLEVIFGPYERLSYHIVLVSTFSPGGSRWQHARDIGSLTLRINTSSTLVDSLSIIRFLDDDAMVLSFIALLGGLMQRCL